VARRISLPSSDELFGDRAPYAGRPADTTTTANGEEAPQTAAAPVARRKAAQRRPAVRSRAATRSKPEPAAVAAKHAIPVAPQRRPSRAPSSGASTQARRRAGVGIHIDRVEGRLRDLPIDTLLELRDGLEGLLTSGAVTDAGVERILASTET
jgi:hypothetical protein